jgi:hypothetical protein
VHGLGHSMVGDSVSETAVAEHMTSGETCIPLRPDGIGLALSALILWWIVTDRRVPSPIAIARRRWPHGPPRRGIDLLRDLSVCRT